MLCRTLNGWLLELTAKPHESTPHSHPPFYLQKRRQEPCVPCYHILELIPTDCVLWPCPLVRHLALISDILELVYTPCTLLPSGCVSKSVGKQLLVSRDQRKPKRREKWTMDVLGLWWRCSLPRVGSIVWFSLSNIGVYEIMADTLAWYS